MKWQKNVCAATVEVSKVALHSYIHKVLDNSMDTSKNFGFCHPSRISAYWVSKKPN